MSKSGDIIQNVLDVSQMKELQANHMNPVTTKQFRKTFVDFLIDDLGKLWYICPKPTRS